MTSLDRSRGFELIDEALREDASCLVEFDRDETDSFSINFTSLGQTNRVLESLTKTDVLPLLPSGSRWGRAVGWRNFSGIPYRFNNTLWVAVGLTEIREHERRGAYPVSRFYFLNFESDAVAAGLSGLIEGLDPGREVDEAVRPAHGAIMGKADTPEDHRQTETWILRRARAAYEQGQKLLFRSAVMSEEDVPSLSLVNLFRRGFSGDNSPIEFRQVLYCTIPSVYDDFGWQSKLKVLLELDITADLTRAP